MSIFITGTDTNIGKTIISSWICYHTKRSYWKPIQTGFKDADIVQSLTQAKIYPEIYHFENPVAPYIAAQMENIDIDPSLIIKPTSERLVIEGAGGVLVPIGKNYLMIDLIKQLQTPVIIVAKSSLGTINHTCLTIESLRSRNIPILGVIINGPLNKENKNQIIEFGKVTILDEFTPLNVLQEIKLRPLSAKLKEALDGHAN
ncbi:MAG: dethiobiotin synthase [Chlamydiae bacterium]|nr:dethiobiotin synthase [Chlamydiota bacterium]